MSKENGIIDSLGLDKIQGEIKSLYQELEKANAGIVGFGEKVSAAIKDAVASLKELKAASNFSELSEAAKKVTKETEGLTAAQKALVEQSKTVETLKARLAALENKEAVEIQATRLEIAEKIKQQKAEAQASIAAEQAMRSYSSILGKSAKSINDLTEQNRQLRRVVETLDVDKQADDIKELNKVIDGNTAIIRMNKDSYVQQKMNIGNYKSALEGYGAQIDLITKKMAELSNSGNTQSDEFKNLQAQLDEAKKNQEEYTEKIGKTVEAEDKLAKQLNDVKIQMQQLNLIGRDNWTKEQEAEYSKLRAEAEELGKAIKRTSDEIKELSTNNLALRGMADGMSLITATVQIGEKAFADLGISTDAYQDILVRLQYAQATINSLQTISNTLRAKSALMIGLQSAAESKNVVVKYAAVTAQKLLNAAQKAMPFFIGAAILASIAGFFIKMASGANKASKAQKMLNEAQKESVKLYGDQAAKINVIAVTMNKTNISITEQKQSLFALNKELENSGIQFKTFAEAQQWIIDNKEKYIQALAEQALAQQLINEYIEAYKNKQEKANTDASEFVGFWGQLWMRATNVFSTVDTFVELGAKAIKDKEEALSEFDDTMATALAGVTAHQEEYNKLMKDLGMPATDAEKETVKQIKKLEDELDKWSKTEIQKLTDKYNEEKKLLEDNGKDVSKLTKKYNADINEINKKSADEQRKVRENIAQLSIATMIKYNEKELAELNAAQEKEITSVTGSKKQKEEQITLINEKYRQKREEMEKKHAADELQAQADAWQLKADISEKGSEQEYNARVNALEVQRKMEVNAAAETGANVNDINTYYDKESLAAFSEFINAKMAKAQEEAEERARIAQEDAAAEEAVLLGKYRNGEINEEKYNKGIADIKHKYAVQSGNDEIAAIQKILDMEGVTGDLRKEIEKKLYEAKKALSDEETSHEVDNIKKVEERRKQATKMAQDLAKQAFDITMEFLTQQSEAKIEEFDAELDRIDEWKEKELERLDESVMSDETRAAETKRINAQAEADRKKVEEEKRKEQQKQAAYQKTSAIISAIIATAQSIVQTGANLGYPLAIPFQVAAGIIGAAQVALIASQPTPKYAEGTDDHPGGYAIVGDARKREYVLTPKGKLFETPAVPTLVDMEKGAQVFPDYQTMMQYFRPEIPKYATTNTGQYEFERMEKNIVGAIRNSKSTQQVQMNLDNNGIWHVANSKSGWKRYINSLTQGQQ